MEKKKLNNLISQSDFKKSWEAKKASKTKRTEVGLDILEKKKILKKAASPETKVDSTPEPKGSGNCETPEMKESLLEALTITDVSNNLRTLVFDADWDHQNPRKTLKVSGVNSYEYDEKGQLILHVQLEANNVVGQSIKIVIGDSPDNILMYDDNYNGKLISGKIVSNTKTWLFNLKQYLPKQK